MYSRTCLVPSVIWDHEGDVYFTYNQDTIHWLLIRVNCSLEEGAVNRIELMDSWGEHPYEGDMDLLEKVRDFFNLSRMLFLSRTEAQLGAPTWQLVAYNTPSCVPRQKDGSSCGVCVCVNAWHLVRGRCLAYECDLGMLGWQTWVFTILLCACSAVPRVEPVVLRSEGETVPFTIDLAQE